MPNSLVIVPPVVGPRIRVIGLSDVRHALSRGVADFLARPSHMVLLGLIYPIVGLVITRATMDAALLPLLFPLAAGFALVGPFAALGLYEISRRRERGLDVAWRDVLAIGRSPSLRAIGEVGVLLLAIFVAWLGAAETLYGAIMGDATPASTGEFVIGVLTTPAGWALIVVGNTVGFLFAALALAVGAVSLPLLLDRPVGFAVAVATSVRCIVANPIPMAAWGAIVAGALLLGSLPLFVGLAVAVPVIGHATWHLYRSLVD